MILDHNGKEVPEREGLLTRLDQLYGEVNAAPQHAVRVVSMGFWEWLLWKSLAPVRWFRDWRERRAMGIE